MATPCAAKPWASDQPWLQRSLHIVGLPFSTGDVQCLLAVDPKGTQRSSPAGLIRALDAASRPSSDPDAVTHGVTLRSPRKRGSLLLRLFMAPGCGGMSTEEMDVARAGSQINHVSSDDSASRPVNTPQDRSLRTSLMVDTLEDGVNIFRPSSLASAATSSPTFVTSADLHRNSADFPSANCRRRVAACGGPGSTQVQHVLGENWDMYCMRTSNCCRSGPGHGHRPMVCRNNGWSAHVRCAYTYRQARVCW